MTLREIQQLHPDWHIVVMTDNMGEVVNCASCGRRVQYGRTYTSFEQWLDDGGAFGLQVCAECYDKELVRKRAANDE